jgi:sporulation protein YlmC with PRC-barrel domain
VDVQIELLLGSKVVDADGKKVGRIEEFRVESEGDSCRLQSYLIGSSALIDRLSAWTLVRPISRALHGTRWYSSYEVPWEDMDLSDPKRPRLRIPAKDLRHAK